MVVFFIFTLFYLLKSTKTHQSTNIINIKSPWLNLPPTPSLPLPNQGYYIEINNNRIWYNIYGKKSNPSVLFLHGGLANSDYWGLQIKEFQNEYYCIVMDSRGQGRSSALSENISYDLMTSDVISLLDYLQINKVHLVGWSDGANIGLNLAMNYPDRLSSLFSFGANYKSGEDNQVIPPLFLTYLQRVENEYKKYHSNEEYQILLTKLFILWKSSNLTKDDFNKIPDDLPVWIVSGDHDEVIPREQTDTISKWIIQSGELILPETSHFAFLQDSEMFNFVLKKFLNQIPNLRNNSSNILFKNSFNILIFVFLFQFLLKYKNY